MPIRRPRRGRAAATRACAAAPGALLPAPGIVDAREYRHQDALIREADLALRAAKRGQSAVVTYTSALAHEESSSAGGGRAHRGTLANALALAVDAKDSSTRSHCQTVSQLCALVATELGLSPDRIVRIRLAGLLHDVGKIGVPDAILNKPGRLDDAEFAQMQRHATLGGDIVVAADLPEESHWIRHHHERPRSPAMALKQLTRDPRPMPEPECMFDEHCPKIDLDLNVGNTMLQVEQLHAGAIDVGFVRPPRRSRPRGVAAPAFEHVRRERRVRRDPAAAHAAEAWRESAVPTRR